MDYFVCCHFPISLECEVSIPIDLTSRCTALENYGKCMACFNQTRAARIYQISSSRQEPAISSELKALASKWDCFGRFNPEFINVC